MPLHDWSALPNWEDLHLLWTTELFRWIKPRLPAGFRASLGTIPALTVAPTAVHPDVSGHRQPSSGGQEAGNGTAVLGGDDTAPAPDEEIAVATLDPVKAVYVYNQGSLVAVLELVSPRNKDRPEARTQTLNRYMGYLLNGIHLVVVDVHRHPLAFSFADALATTLAIDQPACPAPHAVAYRVGPPTADVGRYLARWRRTLSVGSPLPSLPLPLTTDRTVVVDLEQTYARAATDAYL